MNKKKEPIVFIFFNLYVNGPRTTKDPMCLRMILSKKNDIKLSIANLANSQDNSVCTSGMEGVNVLVKGSIWTCQVSYP